MKSAARAFNFSPGPAALPLPVLEQAAAEMLDWQGQGQSVMEMSHRSAAFESILTQTEERLRRLLAIPSDFAVLFMQGGAQAQNAIVPLNLSQGRAVDVVVTGLWSEKSLLEASRYTDAQAAASTKDSGFTDWPPPSSWRLRDSSAYVQLCSNETIHGVEMHEWPDLAALGAGGGLVADASSNILSQPVPWPRVKLVFACAQKNLGIAGLTLVIVRRDALGHALAACPSVFNYALADANRSMTNTPPTYAIYLAGLTLEWIEREGGVAVMDERARARSALIYGAIDASDGFYRNPVAAHARSRMNVPFTLPSESLTAIFLAEATQAGLINLKGHKAVGGIRASMYNAMPLAGAQALGQFMRAFAERWH